MLPRRPQPGLSGLEKWLALGIALLILGGLIFVNLQIERERTGMREQERLLAQAKVIADNMEFQLTAANHALTSIRNTLARRGAAAGRDDISDDLVSLTNAMPGIRTLLVIDASGKALASNRAELVGTDLSGRGYFQMVRKQPNPDTLYVSQPFKTVLDVYSLNLTRMLAGPNGEFAGIVTATVDPEFFKTALGSVLYAPDMWDAIVHGDGQLFLTAPENKPLYGMDQARPGSFFSRHLESGETRNVFTGNTHATKDERMMALHTVRPAALNMDKALVVSTSRELDAIYATWRHNAFTQGMLFAVISLISLTGLYGYQASRRVHEREAREARMMAERFSLALDKIPTYIYMKDRQRRYVYANRPTLELFRVTEAELRGSDDNRFFPPETAKHLYEIDTRVLDHGEDTAEEVIAEQADGSRRVYWEIKTPIYEDAEKTRIWGICGISTDITEHMELLEQLKAQASKDYLTGLSNRRHFMERGENELALARRYDHALSLLMIDIDHFKNINDSHGHKVGDSVLQQLADILRSSFRSVDIIGRIGGEEFAVLLPETAIQQAQEVAERLRLSVEGTDLSQATGLPLHFTISIGAVELGNREVGLGGLLDLADVALYQAKQTGRNRVCVSA